MTLQKKYEQRQAGLWAACGIFSVASLVLTVFFPPAAILTGMLALVFGIGALVDLFLGPRGATKGAAPDQTTVLRKAKTQEEKTSHSVKSTSRLEEVPVNTARITPALFVAGNTNRAQTLSANVLVKVPTPPPPPPPLPCYTPTLEKSSHNTVELPAFDLSKVGNKDRIGRLQDRFGEGFLHQLGSKIAQGRQR